MRERAATRLAGTPTELLKYLGAGLAGTSVHYGVLAVFVRSGLFGPLPASTCGAAAGAAIVYGLNYHLTFCSTKRHREALARFLLVAALGLILNGAVLSTALDRLGWPLAPAQAVATAAQFFAGFLANRMWTF